VEAALFLANSLLLPTTTSDLFALEIVRIKDRLEKPETGPIQQRRYAERSDSSLRSDDGR